MRTNAIFRGWTIQSAPRRAVARSTTVAEEGTAQMMQWSGIRKRTRRPHEEDG